MAAPPLPPPRRAELRLPPRELTVEQTLEVLKRLRNDVGLFSGVQPADLAGVAGVLVPLAFRRSNAIFSRGEPASWLGVLLSGRAKASLPDGLSELKLGELGAGAIVGAARLCLWERSHSRAYTLRATESGYVAVVSYDQLNSLRDSQPKLYQVLLSSLLGLFADAAASFFRNCPLSIGVRWPIAAIGERRVLELLLPLRDAGKLLSSLDYSAVTALACRLRVTQWQARDKVLSMGAPLMAALLVLEGKLTGFRDPSGPPSAWFGPGDCAVLEGALGSVRPCPMDVFAARPTLAAILRPVDLEDLAHDLPAAAAQVARALHSRLLEELAAPHGQALVLLAEGAGQVVFAPGDTPALLPAPLSQVGGLSSDDVEFALRTAQATAEMPQWPFLTAARFMAGPDAQARRDDFAFRQLVGQHPAAPLDEPWPSGEPRHMDWLLGAFLTAKFLEQPLEPPTGDLFDYLEQQRRLLADLRAKSSATEEGVAADLQQAWNQKAAAQQREIQALRARVAELEAAAREKSQGQLVYELAEAQRERDEWRATAMRWKLNAEFKATADRLQADPRSFLRPVCGPAPDFGHALRQQLALIGGGGP